MENTETYTTKPTREAINNLEKDFQFVPERPGDYVVDRKAYIKAMYLQ